MTVVVLADGETYTEIAGCRVLDIPDEIADPDAYVQENWDRGVPISGTPWVRGLQAALTQYRAVEAEVNALLKAEEQAVQRSREALERRHSAIQRVIAAMPDGCGQAFALTVPWEALAYEGEGGAGWYALAGVRIHLVLCEASELARILGRPVVLALNAGPLEVLPGDSIEDLEARYQGLQRH